MPCTYVLVTARIPWKVLNLNELSISSCTLSYPQDMSPSNGHGATSNGHSHASGAITKESITDVLFNDRPMNGSSDVHVNGTSDFSGDHVNGVNGFSSPFNNDATEARRASDSSAADIAICGIGVRLPGGIRSPSDLFDFLAKKGDARCFVPEDRYNVEAFYDPSGKPGTLISKYGYYLDLNLAQFDASMFSMSNAELATVDPSQRLLLEVTRELSKARAKLIFEGGTSAPLSAISQKIGRTCRMSTC